MKKGTYMVKEGVKLFERDSYIKEFTAVVLECLDDCNGSFRLALDRTAFYPEGGGQPSDSGVLIGAQEDKGKPVAGKVTHVCEKDGVIWHTADRRFLPGETVIGRIDWAKRYPRMQNHTGEHLLSGIVKKLYKYENVGFHMGSEFVTLDFDGELSQDEIIKAESLVNEAVYANIPVKAVYPAAKELEAMEYRSKKALNGDVRIVSIPGYDNCACCGTHVASTGEVGIVKIVAAQKYKGGSRLSMLCGIDALRDYRVKNEAVYAISALLSVGLNEVVDAVQKQVNATARFRKQLTEYKLLYLKTKAETIGGGANRAYVQANAGNASAGSIGVGSMGADNIGDNSASAGNASAGSTSAGNADVGSTGADSVGAGNADVGSTGADSVGADNADAGSLGAGSAGGDKTFMLDRVCAFENELDQPLLRQFCAMLCERAELAAAFSPKGDPATEHGSGKNGGNGGGSNRSDGSASAGRSKNGGSAGGSNRDDGAGSVSIGGAGSVSIGGNGAADITREFRYAISSDIVDVKTLGRELNEVFNGRGGGSKRLVEGFVVARKTDIEEFFNKWRGD